jgi:hypothetical protein
VHHAWHCRGRKCAGQACCWLKNQATCPLHDLQAATSRPASRETIPHLDLRRQYSKHPSHPVRQIVLAPSVSSACKRSHLQCSAKFRPHSHHNLQSAQLRLRQIPRRRWCRSCVDLRKYILMRFGYGTFTYLFVLVQFLSLMTLLHFNHAHAIRFCPYWFCTVRFLYVGYVYCFAFLAC